jgi:hypothetical protein
MELLMVASRYVVLAVPLSHHLQLWHGTHQTLEILKSGDQAHQQIVDRRWPSYQQEGYIFIIWKNRQEGYLHTSWSRSSWSLYDQKWMHLEINHSASGGIVERNFWHAVRLWALLGLTGRVMRSLCKWYTCRSQRSLDIASLLTYWHLLRPKVSHAGA